MCDLHINEEGRLQCWNCSQMILPNVFVYLSIWVSGYVCICVGVFVYLSIFILVYFCISVFLHFSICVFSYLCICISEEPVAKLRSRSIDCHMTWTGHTRPPLCWCHRATYESHATFWNLDKCIMQFRQTHFAIWRKNFLQFRTSGQPCADATAWEKLIKNKQKKVKNSLGWTYRPTDPHVKTKKFCFLLSTAYSPNRYCKM